VQNGEDSLTGANEPYIQYEIFLTGVANKLIACGAIQESRKLSLARK